jgi:galactokinase/mevalonate kinase-like predicted kinase
MNTRSQPLPNNQERHARAKGAVIGALIGDAAGGVLEFIGRAPTQVEVAHALNMPGGGVNEVFFQTNLKTNKLFIISRKDDFQL